MTAALGELLRPLPGQWDAALERTIADRLRSSGCEAVDGAAPALASVAALSPHLARLIASETVDLGRALAVPFGCGADTAVVAPSADLDAVGAALRRQKAALALRVALADLCADASVAEVTGTLSAFADAAIATALASALCELAERGVVADAPVDHCGLAVLALGKLGAHELNYSSDVDLVVLFDEERASACGIDADRAVRLTRRTAALLQERTAEGYVFRVDLRLRPDPSATPVAVSTRAAARYMQSRARPWERQAMVKARHVAGDAAASTAYLAAVERSVWPSAYDFIAIDETYRMRAEMAAVRGAGTLTVPRHNVKLGRGGIRELEFFVQSLQRMLGGRDRRLRGRETVPMLFTLADAGWIERECARSLADAYQRLRRVEHRLQMVADEQTHMLPDAAGLPRIAAMMRDDDFEATMRATFELVHRHFTSLPERASRANPTLASSLPGGVEPERELARAIEEAFARWQGGAVPALRTERSRELLDQVRPDLAAAVAASADPSDALGQLDAFFAKLPAGVALLSRLAAHRELVAVFVLVVAAAPRLAQQLARRAHLLDVLIDPAFFGSLPDRAALEAQLDAALTPAAHYEERLDALRVFGQEQMLLVNVQVLTGSVAGREASEALTRLAAVLTARALAVATEAFEERHGRLEDGAVALIGLGSFGSIEMTANSDLDVVFVFDCAEDAQASDGAKPLSPGHYYTRLAQRFIAALSAPTARGMLYEVDLRLRPSGRAGPIATHIRSFERYHAESAWVWEQMALTRSRAVAGDEALGERVLSAIDAAIARPRDLEALAADAASMRGRIAAQKSAGLKYVAGGLVDIEFVAQHLQLARGRRAPATALAAVLASLEEDATLRTDDYETLSGAHRLYRRLAQVFAIASDKAMTLEDAPAALQTLLVRAGEAPDLAFLQNDLVERQLAVRAVFERLVGPLTEG